ncbi:hypothetical protein GNI_023980, partial [Gregarina niphandrodes]
LLDTPASRTPRNTTTPPGIATTLTIPPPHSSPIPRHPPTDEPLLVLHLLSSSQSLAQSTPTPCRLEHSHLPLCHLPLCHLPLGHLPLGHLPLGHLPMGHLPLGHLPLGRHLPRWRVYS